MANRVAVTKVTIEYVCEGRTFTMVFDDPSSIGSIVLSQRDRSRLQNAQGAPLVENRFDPLSEGPVVPFSDKDKKLPPLPIRVAENKEGGASSSIALTEGRSLWWHGSDCPWFHPEGDQ